MATVLKLERISASRLAALLRQNGVDVAVIDVRDDDYIGGHIKGSLNFPSRSLDATMPTLLRKLEDKQTVVFHCALSQERGPRAALRYMRQRESQKTEPGRSESKAAVLLEQPPSGSTASSQGLQEQTVYVLDQGFVGWQRLYGQDKDLTEGYRPELWEEY